jgi:hypothetical protein
MNAYVQRPRQDPKSNLAADRASEARRRLDLRGNLRAGLGDNTPTRAQLSAVKRALKRMHLPGTWRTGRAWGRDRRWWLYDPRRLAADPWHRCPLAPIELAELELVEISLPAEDA